MRVVAAAYLKSSSLSQSPFKEHCPYITARPECYSIDVDDRDSFIILACELLFCHSLRRHGYLCGGLP